MCGNSALNDHLNTHSLYACIENDAYLVLNDHIHAFSTCVCHHSCGPHVIFNSICMPSHLVNCYMSLFKIIQHSLQAIEQSECAFALCVFFTFLKKSAHACVKCIFEWVKMNTFSVYGYFGHMTPEKELFLAFSHLKIDK